MPAAVVFQRGHWNKPWRILLGFDSPITVVAVNPKPFSLRNVHLGKSPRCRWVFAACSITAVVLYDTEQATPIALVTNLHVTQITDARW